MKKKLITILSLIMTFVLCFSLVACGGDNDKSKVKKPTQQGKVVSISLNDAIGAVEGVLNANSFTGAASVTLSTKNTQTLTESVALDKRGNKLKITAGADEHIVNLQTGYVYRSGANGYTFKNVYYENTFEYAQYLLASFAQQASDRKIDVRYDNKSNTITYAEERADSVNKYLEPLQNAYKKDKNIGILLDDYCTLLFGKKFNDMYGLFEKYISKPENTVGTLLDELNKKGVDVEAILEMTGYGLPAEQMAAVKARPLNKLVVGMYTYLEANFKNMLPFAIDETGDETDTGNDGADDAQPDDSQQEGGGMQSFAEGLINAMLFTDYSEKEITAGLQGLKGMLNLAKKAGVKSIVDMALADNDKAADLYTVIKNGVKLKNATMTLTLTVDDNKAVKGVKIDFYAAHTYNGAAAEDSFLADNNYRATAQITIDEYNTPTADFVMNFDPDCDYKTPLVSYLYEVNDKDVEVYCETGGKTVNMTGFFLEIETPDGQQTSIENLPAPAISFMFDNSSSSFVFNGAIVKSALENAPFGTFVTAYVFFDGDDSNAYGIRLVYVNDDWQDIKAYVRNVAMDKILGFIGGGSSSQAPDQEEATAY